MFSPEQRRYVGAARVGRLATSDADGRPHVVPVCFALVDESDSRDDDGGTRGSWIATPVDEKPKDAEPADLRRVRDVRENARVALVVDHWTEDWDTLGWLQVRGMAEVLPPGSDGHADAVDALRRKYDQYADHALEERPIVRIEPGHVVSWGSLERPATAVGSGPSDFDAALRLASMTFDADRVHAVTIDSYSTVVDFRAAARALEGHVDEPEAVAAVWRERSLTYGSMSNYLGGYEPFWEMLGHALEYALAAHDEDLPSDDREEVLAVYEALPEFDDVRPGLERITEAGYDVYVLSNGSPEMLASMVENAGVADLVVDEISVDEVGKYKPHPEVYRNAAARTGTPIREIAHASAGWFDALGAMNVGMQGVWMNRTGAPPETWGPEPDLTVSSFEGLADALE